MMSSEACLVCALDSCERFTDDGKAQHRRITAQLRDWRHAKWSKLEWRDDPSWGARWFLDDRPIHCGDGLELQIREARMDDGDEFYLPVQRGLGVRFELAWTLDARGHQEMFRGGKLPMMHVAFEGYGFERPIEAEMRFRWPVREGA